MELERLIAALAPEAVTGARERALVVERELGHDVPQLVVPDSRAAMAVAADAFFGEPTRELEVAGVTGTNGKTTTAFLLHSILDAAGRRPRPPGSRPPPGRRRGGAAARG